MSKSELEKYIHQMQMSGCWGDGIMLSVAARLYGRPVEITLADGSVSSIDTGNTGIASSSMEPIRLCLIGNHYVSIQDSAGGEVNEMRGITPTTAQPEESKETLVQETETPLQQPQLATQSKSMVFTCYRLPQIIS